LLVRDQLACKLLQSVERSIERLLQPTERWIDALDARERALNGCELLQHGVVVPFEDAGHALRKRAKLLGVLETTGLFLQTFVFACSQLRRFDLLRHVTQIVRATFSVRTPRLERLNV